jgi:hypothetical protein
MYCLRTYKECELTNCTCMACISGGESPENCSICDYNETCIYQEEK